MAVLLVSPVCAQEGPDPEAAIEEIRRAYRELEYEQAEKRARRALTEYQQLSIGQLMEIHRLLGLIEISQNDQPAARRHFEAALSLNPNLSLDPTFVSPKIIDFFQDVRREYLVQTADVERDSVAIRYRLIPDPRPAAALRSAVLPGWGQLHKGQTAKGRLLMGLWGASTGGAVLTHVLGRMNENARENGRGNTQWWYGARNGLIAVAAGTWLGSYLDALITSQEPSVQTAQMIVAPDAGLRPHLTLRIHF